MMKRLTYSKEHAPYNVTTMHLNKYYFEFHVQDGIERKLLSFPTFYEFITTMSREPRAYHVYTCGGGNREIAHIVMYESDQIESCTYLQNDGVGIGAIMRFKDIDKQVYFYDVNYLFRDDISGMSSLELSDFLMAIWQVLYKEHGTLGPQLCGTTGALAMKLFQKQLERNLYMPDEEVAEIGQQAYRGGICGCLMPGHFYGVQCFDVNSMYPYVMSRFPYPYGKTMYTTTLNLDRLGLWYCEWSHDAFIPNFCFDEDQKQPQASGRGWLTTPEVRRLLELGSDVQCNEGYVFQSTIQPFKTFVEKMYPLRRHVNPYVAQLHKLILNSLYGKFGQKEETWSMQMLRDGDMERLLASEQEFYIHGPMSITKEYRNIRHRNPVWAAYITAYARCHLHRLMQEIEGDSANVLYYDTDSIHVVGEVNRKTSRALGDLKLEWMGEAVYLGRKKYAYRNESGEHIKLSGADLESAVGKVSFDNLVDALHGKNTPIQFESMASLQEILSGRCEAGDTVRRRYDISFQNLAEARDFLVPNP